MSLTNMKKRRSKKEELVKYIPEPDGPRGRRVEREPEKKALLDFTKGGMVPETGATIGTDPRSLIDPTIIMKSSDLEKIVKRSF